MVPIAPWVMLVAASAMAAPAVDGAAAVLERGMAAYAAGDYAGARRDFALLADRGSAIAETMLGAMAADGQGGAADPATAVSYWYRAANRGYAPGQLALARALAAGRGVGRDPGQAWLWAQLAARYGDPVVADASQKLTASVGPAITAAQRRALQQKLLEWRPWTVAVP